jgi:hypothetical protein
MGQQGHPAMTDSAEYLIHEGHGIEVYAVVSFKIQPAYGDGYHEQHEAAHVEIRSAKLFKRTSRKVPQYTDGRYTGFLTEYTVTQIDDDVPEWVDDIIEADEDWQNDILANALADDIDADDRAYDERRDLQLTER